MNRYPKDKATAKNFVWNSQEKIEKRVGGGGGGIHSPGHRRVRMAEICRGYNLGSGK